MSFWISFGRWGGFYLAHSDMSTRICLGWVAMTVYKFEIDSILEEWVWFKKATETINPPD